MVRTHSSVVEQATFNSEVASSNLAESTNCLSSSSRSVLDFLASLPKDQREKFISENQFRLRRELDEIKQYHRSLEERSDLLKRHVSVLKELTSWLESLDEKPSYTAVESSAWHRLAEAGSADLLIGPTHGAQLDTTDAPRIVLISHNWSMAVNATDGDEWRLPFPRTAFEFKMSGRRCIALGTQADGDPTPKFIAIYQVGDAFVWSRIEMEQIDEAAARLIRGACIALDAEVVTADIVRAPSKLNASRLKRGAPPVQDFYVLNIARRNRAAALAIDGSTDQRKVRLHFRRGHWRHYETHKTWIRWTLVGDPDLGFLDKHYRL